MVTFSVTIPTRKFTIPEKIEWNHPPPVAFIYSGKQQRDLLVRKHARRKFMQIMGDQFDRLYDDAWASVQE
jgi:hypothetical protein